jgi:hypothetical protein
MWRTGFSGASLREDAWSATRKRLRGRLKRGGGVRLGAGWPRYG